MAPPHAAPVAATQDETTQLARELRDALAQLLAARETIRLQRAELERLATMDAVTGVLGRGAVIERMRIEVAEARRYAHPVVALLLAVDGLAGLNRAQGLTSGDAVLREIALRLRVRVREADALGRTSGDTFLALLPHTDDRGATIFAEALRERVVGEPVETPAGPVAVTASIGISLMRAGTELTVDELLGRAEEALRSAQAAGGNRIAYDRLHGLARLEPPHRADPGAARAGRA
jgi:diguanylate cyclase (GGDEF)-like protein